MQLALSNVERVGKLENPKHELLCQQYVANHCNATKAAELSGFSKSTGIKLLKEPKLLKRVEELKRELYEKLLVDRVTVAHFLLNVASVSITDYFEQQAVAGSDGTTRVVTTPKPFEELTDAQRMAIHEIKTDSNGNVVGYKLINKLNALQQFTNVTGITETPTHKPQVPQVINQINIVHRT